MVMNETVVPSRSSCRSSTTPWSSTFAMRSLETLGMAGSFLVDGTERRRRAALHS
jgi:hypothetical protein